MRGRSQQAWFLPLRSGGGVERERQRARDGGGAPGRTRQRVRRTGKPNCSVCFAKNGGWGSPLSPFCILHDTRCCGSTRARAVEVTAKHAKACSQKEPRESVFAKTFRASAEHDRAQRHARGEACAGRSMWRHSSSRQCKAGLATGNGFIFAVDLTMIFRRPVVNAAAQHDCGEQIWLRKQKRQMATPKRRRLDIHRGRRAPREQLEPPHVKS